MTAQPVPKLEPDPAPESNAADAEGWALLEALRRRLDDQGALGRKTQSQVGQLAESIGALVAEQRRRSKWANLNSFVAYVLFTLLVGAGFYLLYRSRAHELVEARDSAQRERDQAVQRADELTAKATARDRADTTAWDVYQLLEAGKRTEAAGKLAALSELPLSRTERAVLAARAHETQVMEVDAALKSAAGSFKAGRYADVVAPLEAALVSEPAGARAATMRYFLGVAYAKGTQLDKAAALLAAAVAAEVDQDDARFQLASVLDRSGQYARARTEYDRFATAHPQSTLAVFAMRRSATLARMPATAPTTPSPGAVKPAAAGNPTGSLTTPSPGAAGPSGSLKAPSPGAVTPAGADTPAASPRSAVTVPSAAAPTSRPTAPKTAPLRPKLLPGPAKLPAAPADTAGSAAEPMSSGEPPPDDSRTPKREPAPRAEPAPSQLPSFDVDRAPPPSPLGPPVDRDPAPAPANVPRGEPPPPPLRF